MSTHITFTSKLDNQEIIISQDFITSFKNKYLSAQISENFKEGRNKKVELNEISGRSLEIVFRILLGLPSPNDIIDLDIAAELYDFSHFADLPNMAKSAYDFARNHFHELEESTKTTLIQDFDSINQLTISKNQRLFYTQTLLMKACSENDTLTIKELIPRLIKDKSLFDIFFTGMLHLEECKKILNLVFEVNFLNLNEVEELCFSILKNKKFGNDSPHKTVCSELKSVLTRHHVNGALIKRMYWHFAENWDAIDLLEILFGNIKNPNTKFKGQNRFVKEFACIEHFIRINVQKSNFSNCLTILATLKEYHPSLTQIVQRFTVVFLCMLAKQNRFNLIEELYANNLLTFTDLHSLAQHFFLKLDKKSLLLFTASYHTAISVFELTRFQRAAQISSLEIYYTFLQLATSKQLLKVCCTENDRELFDACLHDSYETNLQTEYLFQIRTIANLLRSRDANDTLNALQLYHNTYDSVEEKFKPTMPYAIIGERSEFISLLFEDLIDSRDWEAGTSFIKLFPVKEQSPMFELLLCEMLTEGYFNEASNLIIKHMLLIGIKDFKGDLWIKYLKALLNEESPDKNLVSHVISIFRRQEYYLPPQFVQIFNELISKGYVDIVYEMASLWMINSSVFLNNSSNLFLDIQGKYYQFHTTDLNQFPFSKIVISYDRKKMYVAEALNNEPNYYWATIANLKMFGLGWFLEKHFQVKFLNRNAPNKEELKEVAKIINSNIEHYYIAVKRPPLLPYCLRIIQALVVYDEIETAKKLLAIVKGAKFPDSAFYLALHCKLLITKKDVNYFEGFREDSYIFYYDPNDFNLDSAYELDELVMDISSTEEIRYLFENTDLDTKKGLIYEKIVKKLIQEKRFELAEQCIYDLQFSDPQVRYDLYSKIIFGR